MLKRMAFQGQVTLNKYEKLPQTFSTEMSKFPTKLMSSTLSRQPLNLLAQSNY